MSFCNRHLKISVMASLLLPLSFMAGASSKTPGKVISGWVEYITVPETGETVKAKLDTGARTSSMHASDIEIFKRDGKRWVRFKLKLNEGSDAEPVIVERDRERRVRIKEDDEQGDSRPSVQMEVCFNGRKMMGEFTLNDRKGYVYPILLGRRFLEGVAVIDPEKTFLTQSGCGSR